MKQKRSNIFFWLAKLPLLLLYVSFFTVQLFYNFDIANHPASTTLALTHNSDKPKDSHASLKKAPGPTGQKTSFRLNKRYHPQPAITCNVVIIKQVICYVSSKLHIHYSSGFVPSSFPPLIRFADLPLLFNQAFNNNFSF